MVQKKYIFVGSFVLLLASVVVSCDSINKVTNSFSKKTPQTVVDTPKVSSSIGGRWVLNYITGPRITFAGLFPNKKPYMILDSAKSQVSGNTGCNNFSGPFKVYAGDSIEFKQMATTMMNCADGGQGETLFLGTLDKVSHYRVSGDTLWLRFKKIEAMRFLRDTSTVK
ncbi:MAG: META domain-containing protein [Pseudopedobacter saltans]|uniref:META domain-containing protein n=1 Tax=Pseudopedobacter saltans TaxID=151895 RepID=A0A2W5ELK4_9SPHI|nr:MAG: META domain-containing protein [Pseudopedobacter saltans]